MNPTDLSSFISTVESATEDALGRVTAAQLQAQVLTDLGEQLVGHFVSRAKADGASWSQIGEALGVSKQAAQQRSADGFARYTDRARQVVVLAQESARTHRHDHIGTAHLLVGLLGVPGGVAAALLERHAGSPESARALVDGLLGPAADRPTQRLAFDPVARAALERSVSVAAELEHDFVGTEHVLLGIVAADDPTAAALAAIGLDPDTTRTEVQTAVAELVGPPVVVD